jgi:hypothetical protein
VPAIPLTHAHGVCVELLVQIIQQTNSLQLTAAGHTKHWLQQIGGL